MIHLNPDLEERSSFVPLLSCNNWLTPYRDSFTRLKNARAFINCFAYVRFYDLLGRYYHNREVCLVSQICGRYDVQHPGFWKSPETHSWREFMTILFFLTVSFMADKGPITKDSKIIYQHRSTRLIPIYLPRYLPQPVNKSQLGKVTTDLYLWYFDILITATLFLIL